MNTLEKPGTLLSRTRALLHKDTRSLVEIHSAAGVPFYWLKKFSSGEIREPSVNRVQKLYEHLTQTKLLN